MAISATFNCTVITPERQVLDTEATFLAFPAHDGEIGILRNRAPLLCKLGVGVMRIEAAPRGHRLYIDGGFAQVLDNRVTILTQQALAPDEIDVDATRRALDETRAQKAETTDQVETRRQTILRHTAKLKAATGTGD